MYFWKTRLLAEDLRNNSLTQENVKNYYLATSIVAVAGMYLAMLQPRENMQALATEALGTLIVTILGINATFSANGKGAGSRFIEKAVSLSVPLLSKVLIAGFIAGLLTGVLGAFGISTCLLEWGNTVALVAIQVIFYWRLATHIKHTNA